MKHTVKNEGDGFYSIMCEGARVGSVVRLDSGNYLATRFIPGEASTRVIDAKCREAAAKVMANAEALV